MQLGAFVGIEFEHVAHVDETDHLVRIAFVDRDARILLGDDQFAQVLKRAAGIDGHDVGPGRHHLANHLVAELDNRLDELAVVFLDEALFGAGVDERLDVFRGRGFFFLAVSGFSQLHQRLEKLQYHDDRPYQQGRTPQDGNERRHPAAGRAAVQQIRQQISGQQHPQPAAHGQFQKSGPTVGTDDCGHAAQYQDGMLDQREGQRAALDLHAEALLERFVEIVQGRALARAQAGTLQVQQLREGHQAEQQAQ